VGVVVGVAEGGWKWMVVSLLTLMLNGSSESDVQPVGSNTNKVMSTAFVPASIVAKFDKAKKLIKRKAAIDDESLELDAREREATASAVKAKISNDCGACCGAQESSLEDGLGVRTAL